MPINVKKSLSDLLGVGYTHKVCEAHAVLTGEEAEKLYKIADEPVDFCDAAYVANQERLMAKVGQPVVPAFDEKNEGAPTQSYKTAQHSYAAPLSGVGAYRVGEDGRLYFIGKSEHYQSSLGHQFPGYRLIENAKKIGILNATHNGTRGYVTRLLERKLIAAANGISADDPQMEEILSSRKPGVLSTVINLETGSLAVEAALKMMLARFYPLDKETAPYAGRIPVFFVMADYAGGVNGNYHGTTIFAQTLRGLWNSFCQKAEESGLYKVVSVAINDADDFAKKMTQYNCPPYKTAGFCHELILMNYGGIRLDEDYLHAAYKLCRENDTPILCDEIQSCAWYDGMFLFRQYGLTPDFVSVGKGFPGGEYPASKMLSSGAYDNLSQFGALVTNGQEELASLAYLITMAFHAENGAELTANGDYYHEKLAALAKAHAPLTKAVQGQGLMSALTFDTSSDAVEFCQIMSKDLCVDVSAQAYKASCPPAALTKLPLITTRPMIDGVISLFDKGLRRMEEIK